MRLVYDPVRHHFMKSIIPAEKFVESAVSEGLYLGEQGVRGAIDMASQGQQFLTVRTRVMGDEYFNWADRYLRQTKGRDFSTLVLKHVVMFGIPLAYIPYGVMRYSPTNLLLRTFR